MKLAALFPLATLAICSFARGDVGGGGGTYTVPAPTICPPIETGTTLLTFEDEGLVTTYKSPFPSTYKGFVFSGSAGWMLLNTQSPRAPPAERRAAISLPNALVSQSYGMVRWGAPPQGGTFTSFDLVEFYIYGWATMPRRSGGGMLIVTIRTDKTPGFPYAVPITNQSGNMVKAEEVFGDAVRGIAWVEIAVWQRWDWNSPKGGQGSLEGNPANGWSLDSVSVRKRSCKPQ